MAAQNPPPPPPSSSSSSLSPSLSSTTTIPPSTMTAQKLHNDLEALLQGRGEDALLKKINAIRNQLEGLGSTVDVGLVAGVVPRLVILYHQRYPASCELIGGLAHLLRVVCAHVRGGEACAQALAAHEPLNALLALFACHHCQLPLGQPQHHQQHQYQQQQQQRVPHSGSLSSSSSSPSLASLPSSLSTLASPPSSLASLPSLTSTPTISPPHNHHHQQQQQQQLQHHQARALSSSSSSVGGSGCGGGVGSGGGSLVGRELYALLALVAPHDRKFAVHARLSGVYTAPLTDLDAALAAAASAGGGGGSGPSPVWSRDTVQPILQVLRAVLANKLNVTLLNRRGLLTRLLAMMRRKAAGTIDTEMLLLTECLMAASKSRKSVKQLLDQGALELLIPLLERGELLGTDKIRYLLAVLEMVSQIVFHKVGRVAATRMGLCPKLMSMAETAATSNQQRAVLNSISEVFYHCLPRLKLPVEGVFKLNHLHQTLKDSPSRPPSSPNRDYSKTSLGELFDRITSFDDNLEDLPFLGELDRNQVLHKLAKFVQRPEGAQYGNVSWVAEPEFWMLSPQNTHLSLEPLNVSPAHDSVALLNHMRAHHSGELLTKRCPVVYDVLQGPLFEDLAFESRFEGGNLRYVVQRSPQEYDLVLNSDVNTNRHHFWFYFAVKNLTGRVVYTFNIINLDRRNTMYTKRGTVGGLSPILFSDGTWTRLSSLPGFSLSCYKNHYRHPVRNLRYCTLSLTFLLPSNSTCYLSSSFPYSYSLLRTHLCTASFNSNAVFYKVRKLCDSALGNKCYLVTIANRTGGLSRALHKPVIFLSSRVHPGETNSSHILHGALQALLSDHPTSESLREKFVFYIVPMLNPDGVVCGNQRCGLIGTDLNRQYDIPCRQQHPTVYHTKALLEYLANSGRPPFVVIDIHGHSRAHNVFMFGCADTPAQRLLPHILHSQLKSFNEEQCTYKVEASKRGALRISAWEELNLSLSYTMECTVAGCDFRSYKGYHLGIEQLEEIGRELVWALDKIGTDHDTLDIIAAKTDFSSIQNQSRTASPAEQVKDSESSTSDGEETGENAIEEGD